MKDHLEQTVRSQVSCKGLSDLVFVAQHFFRNESEDVLKVARLSDRVIMATVRKRAPGLGFRFANGKQLGHV